MNPPEIPREELLVRLGRVRNRIAWELSTLLLKGDAKATAERRRQLREEIEALRVLDASVRQDP
jgi:hypothetical protein